MEKIRLYYERLMEKAKAIVVLQSAKAIINWDMETMMPPKGINLRSEQLALISQIEHRMITDRQIGILLEKILEHPDYESMEEEHRRNVHLLKKSYDEQSSLPEELVKETARQRVVAVDTWKKAKAAEDFSIFEPELEKIVELRRRAAEILMDVKQTATPYDALIDTYEPKITSETIADIFDNLRRGLTSILDKCQEAEKQSYASFLQRRIPVLLQRRIASSIADFLGYDVASEEAGGRIDETEHPFATGYYDDVRITTHYYEDRFASSIFSVLHECGHALYEQNLNREWMYQPIGSSCSQGFHESQARFVENIIGRSREFWSYFLPRLKNLTGSLLSDVDLEAYVYAINQVKPSKIRVEADEVTYCLHIIIRFEIERDLMRNKMNVEDLPEVWNQKYLDYLGLTIKNDSEGVMQDTHWAYGDIGYFPTYALGNIYSGQILNEMERQMPGWRSQIAEGFFQNIKNWLTEYVYRYGNLYDPAELIRKITGEGINSTHYLNYLREKYSILYGF